MEKCLFQLSYTTEYGWCSCGKEKVSIHLEAHHKAQWSEIFCFPQKIAVIFFPFPNPAETATLRSGAFKRRTAYRIPAKRSCSSHLFGVVPSRAAQTAFVPELSKAITFCLMSDSFCCRQCMWKETETSGVISSKSLF